MKERKWDNDNLHVAWRVKFEPGTVKVIARESGNVMSGTVLMGLIYDLLSPFTVAYPAVLHAYFDLFSGCIQAYVFCMLTMVYVNDKIAD